MYTNVSSAEMAAPFLRFMFTKSCLFYLIPEMFDIEMCPLYKLVREIERIHGFITACVPRTPFLCCTSPPVSITRSIRLCYSQNICKQRSKKSARFSLWVPLKTKTTDVYWIGAQTWKDWQGIRLSPFPWSAEPVPNPASNPGSPEAL